MESIMDPHITPLVITSLGDGHTDTHAHTHKHTLRGQDQSIETRRAPACGQHAPGLIMIIYLVQYL